VVWRGRRINHSISGREQCSNRGQPCGRNRQPRFLARAKVTPVDETASSEAAPGAPDVFWPVIEHLSQLLDACLAIDETEQDAQLSG
jgi:hypothetical protein